MASLFDCSILPRVLERIGPLCVQTKRIQTWFEKVYRSYDHVNRTKFPRNFIEIYYFQIFLELNNLLIYSIGTIYNFRTIFQRYSNK